MATKKSVLQAPLTLHGSASGKRRGGSGTSKPPALSTPRAETFLEPKTLSHRESVFFSWTVHCAAVGGSAAYGCGIPLAGAARFLFGKTEKKMGGAISFLLTSPHFFAKMDKLRSN